MEFIDYNGNDITSIIMQPNDNILFNSDWMHSILNKKGELSYNTVSSYTIDMWVIVAHGTVIVNENSISITGNIRQFFNELEIGKDYTVTIRKNGKIESYTYKNFNGNETDGYVNGLGIQLHKRYLTIVENNTGNGKNIEFIKLEKGSYFTGMREFDTAKERIRSMHKYRIMDIREGGGVTTGKMYLPRITYPFEVYMDKDPVVNIISTGLIYNCKIEVESCNRYCLVLRISPIDPNEDWVVLDYRIELDSYDYQ